MFYFVKLERPYQNQSQIQSQRKQTFWFSMECQGWFQNQSQSLSTMDTTKDIQDKDTMDSMGNIIMEVKKLLCITHTIIGIIIINQAILNDEIILERVVHTYVNYSF